MTALERIRAVPAVGWLLLAVAAAMVLLCWHSFARDDQDTSWLNPEQPPLNVDVDMSATVAGVLAPVFRAPRLYPWASLTEHPGCWVGDC